MIHWFSLWAKHLRAAQGWRRLAQAFLYGAIAALAFPPFNAVAALWFCFPALAFLLQGTRTLRQAFAVGWSFAFGLLTISFYWIAGSLFVDIKTFWWALPFSVFGLPAAMALYYGFAAMAARRWGVERGGGLVALALFWFLADFARGHLLTGFPWDVTGYVWSDVLPVLQLSSVIGLYGLTLVTLVLAVLPAACFPARGGALSRSGLAVLVASLVGLAAVAGWGQGRLSHASDAVADGVRLRLVQPGMGQALKWKADQRELNFERLLDLSFAPAQKPVTHIVWPETATAFYLVEDAEHRRELAVRMTPGTSVITGVVRTDRSAGGEAATKRYYNAIIAIDDHGRVVAGYDKFHLVPFGEYMPLRSLLSLPTVAGMGTDFSSGAGPRTTRVAGLPPFSPLICYEAIFSGAVVEKGDPPQFLLNATNDAWYEHTIGPYQHFAIARVRAVEEGLPLVRAANMGVTAVVDAYGRVRARLGWEQAGFVDSDLPLPLPAPTPYSQDRDRPLWMLFGLLLCGATCFRWAGSWKP